MLGKTYEDMTLIQLREIAKEIGIKNITKKKKSELIEDIKLNSPKAIEKDGVILKEKIAPKVLEHDIVDNNNENDSEKTSDEVNEEKKKNLSKC